MTERFPSAGLLCFQMREVKIGTIAHIGLRETAAGEGGTETELLFTLAAMQRSCRSRSKQNSTSWSRPGRREVLITSKTRNQRRVVSQPAGSYGINVSQIHQGLLRVQLPSLSRNQDLVPEDGPQIHGGTTFFDTELQRITAQK